MTPRVLAVLPGLIPSTTLNIVKPLTELHMQGKIHVRFTVEHLTTRDALENADLVVFCRNIEPRYGWILEQAVVRRIPVIYDIDDNLFIYPPALAPNGDPVLLQQRLAQLVRYVQTAALVRGYSPALIEHIQQYTPHAILSRTYFDWKLIAKQRPPLASGKLKIVYATSRIHMDKQSSIFLPALCDVLASHAGKLAVTFWGYHPPQLHGHPDVRFLPIIRDYDQFIRKFAAEQFDIGLAPMFDDEFYRSKTNNKFREYGACRIAGVYSDGTVYQRAVTHEHTGLLVADDGWSKGLLRLIEDKTLRERISKNAYQHVRQYHTLEQSVDEWAQQIDQVLTSAAWGGVTGASVVVSRPSLPTVMGSSLQSAKGLLTRGVQGVRRRPLLGWRHTLYQVIAHLDDVITLFRLNRRLR